ncbi:MAG: hypothetical protein PHH28_07410 [Desulfuromonadaceae bacterium]|nr:hypothetical protein [Desulfuromonadaceae bacterium]
MNQIHQELTNFIQTDVAARKANCMTAPSSTMPYRSGPSFFQHQPLHLRRSPWQRR